MSEMRIGMIGLDTSHCVAFARNLNNSDDPHHVPGARVVAAFRGGSEIFSGSRDRVDKYTQQLTDEFGVELCDSIAELGRNVDAIMLQSVDGRQHLDQFSQLTDCGKPVFVDKPFTCSFKDARKLAQLARENEIPVMSCSAIRWGSGIANLCDKENVLSCEAFGPAPILDDYPGLFWYGIHSADVLFSFMGKGCRSVRTISGDQIDVVVGQWEDGRIGSLRCFRAPDLKQFGCTIATEKEILTGLLRKDPPYYALMLRQIVEFFRTRTSPIDLDETVEIMGFLESADRSKAQNAAPIPLSY